MENIHTAAEEVLGHKDTVLQKAEDGKVTIRLLDGTFEGTPVSKELYDQIMARAAVLDANPPARKVGNFGEFMRLFTEEEQVRIKTATMNPASVLVALWYDQALAANQIDLDSPEADMAFTVLVQAGLLTQERADAIRDKGYA